MNAEGTLHARSLGELLRPDILMLDATGFSPDELSRQVGSLASGRIKIAVKRIETAEMAEALLASGADWVQGHHFNHPRANIADELAVEA